MKCHVLLLLFVLVVLFSCDTSEIIQNSEADMKVAKVLTNDFYNAIRADDTANVYLKLDKSIKTADFDKVFKNSRPITGTLLKHKIIHIKTTSKTINNQHFKTEYLVELNVEYDKCKTVENLGFVKRSSEDPLLFSYHFYIQ